MGSAVVTFELPFEVPQSVSWVWGQADAQVRSQIIHAMVNYGNSALAYLTHNRPVVRGVERAAPRVLSAWAARCETKGQKCTTREWWRRARAEAEAGAGLGARLGARP